MKLILGSKLVSQEAPESIRKASMLVFTSMFATATQAAVLTGFLKVPKASSLLINLTLAELAILVVIYAGVFWQRRVWMRWFLIAKLIAQSSIGLFLILPLAKVSGNLFLFAIYVINAGLVGAAASMLFKQSSVEWGKE